MDRPWKIDRDRYAWGLVGLGLLGVLALVVWPFLGTFSVAVFLYYATRPLYRRVRARTDHSNLAATVTLLAVAVPALVVVGYAGLVGLQSLDRALAAADLQQYRSMLEPYTGAAGGLAQPQQLLAEARRAMSSSGGAAGVLGSVGAAVGTLFAVLLRLFLVFAFAFYFLRDDHRLSAWFHGVFGAGRNPDDGERTVVEEFTAGVDSDLETVYVGNLLNVAAIAVIALAANHLLNVVAPAGAAVPSPTLLALLTGVASLVPAVGMKIVYVPVTAVLLGTALLGGGSLWFALAYFAVTFVVVDTIPDFAVRAYLSGRTLHMGLVMFSYILGSVAFGWYGIFLGPLLLVVMLHFGKTVLPVVVSDDRSRVPSES